VGGLLKSNSVPHKTININGVLGANGLTEEENNGVPRVEVARERSADPLRPRVEVDDPATHDELVGWIEIHGGTSASRDVEGLGLVAFRDEHESPVEAKTSIGCGGRHGDGQVLDLPHALDISRRHNNSA